MLDVPVFLRNINLIYCASVLNKLTNDKLISVGHQRLHCGRLYFLRTRCGVMSLNNLEYVLLPFSFFVIQSVQNADRRLQTAYKM